MARHAEQVAAALAALVNAALPFADNRRNEEKAVSIGGGGATNLLDGDPGDPEVCLSPLSYSYEHVFELNLGAYDSASMTKEQVIDAMLVPIGAAIRADRTLGGLCEWVEASAPTLDDLDLYGGDAPRWANVPILCAYTTSDPLA